MEKALTELEKTVEALRQEIEERKKLEAALRLQSISLADRVRELRCLYDISRLVTDPGISFDQIFQDSAAILVDALEYANVTAIRIVIHDQEYLAGFWNNNDCVLSKNITVDGKNPGFIQVIIPQSARQENRQAFIQDANNLLETVSRLLGDVIRRKEKEEALLKSERKYKTLLENLPQKIFYKDRDSVYISCNDHYAQDLHISSEAIEGKTDFDFFPAPMAEKYREDDQHIMASGEIQEYDEPYQSNGKEYTIHMVKTPVKDEAGQVVGILGIFWDTPELKHVREELETRSKLFRALMDHTPAMIYIKDLNGRYLNINRMYELLFDTTLEKTEGKTPYDLFPPGWAEKFDAVDRQVAESGVPVLMEEIVPHKDGMHTYLSSKFVLHNFEGTPYAVCVISIDITQRKKTEEELKQYKDHLEEMVVQRTSELEQFIFVASHDLQEPLRKIMAFGDRLSSRLGDQLDERSHFYLERITVTANNMRYLLDDLLLYSRLLQSPRSFAPVDVNRQVYKALENLEILVSEKDAFIDIEPLPKIMGNEWQIRQLFQNIIANSLKYSQVNIPPQVIIRGYPIENQWVEFTIKDNGIGFDEKYMDRLFKPFQRLHSRGEFQGTGMGLTICKKVIEQHKGNIRLQSAPGQGTTVTLQLPLYIPDEENSSDK